MIIQTSGHNLERDRRALAGRSSIVSIISLINDISDNFIHRSVAYQFDYLFTNCFKNDVIFYLFLKTKKKFQKVEFVEDVAQFFI